MRPHLLCSCRRGYASQVPSPRQPRLGSSRDGNALAPSAVVCSAFQMSVRKRRSAMRPILAISLCAALLVSARAQAAPLDGRWTVTTEATRGTTDNGSNWSLGANTGTLTLTQDGNDITGSWKGQMAAPWTVTGQLNDRAFVLQTEWRDIPATRDGVQSTARARWIFRGTVSGDNADGKMTLELENAGGDRSQPFKAKRAQ